MSLDNFTLFNISKYFNDISDFINLSKTCKSNYIIDKYTYNPLPINIEQLLIFENLENININKTENKQIENFLNNYKSILLHLNKKFNITNHSKYNILKYKKYFNNIYTRLKFTDWFDNGCNENELSYVDKIENNAINKNNLKYIVIPKNVIKISKNAFNDCPDLLFIIVLKNSDEIINKCKFNDCPKFQGIIYNDKIIFKDNSCLYYTKTIDKIVKPKYNPLSTIDYINQLKFSLKQGIPYYNNIFENKTICKIYKTSISEYYVPITSFKDNATQTIDLKDINFRLDENIYVLSDYNYKSLFNYIYINQQYNTKCINDYPDFNVFATTFKSNVIIDSENLFYARYTSNDLYEDIKKFKDLLKFTPCINEILNETWYIECKTNINDFKIMLKKYINLCDKTDEFIDKLIETKFTKSTNNLSNDCIEKIKNGIIPIELINDYVENINETSSINKDINKIENNKIFSNIDKCISELMKCKKGDENTFKYVVNKICLGIEIKENENENIELKNYDKKIIKHNKTIKLIPIQEISDDSLDE